MLRVVKIKSPMSMGVWGLVAFSGTSALSALAARRGVRSRALTSLQLALGAFVSGYTGVLLSATANPFWSKGKVHIPAACVCSGLAGAAALNAVLLGPRGSSATLRRLERLETAASALETIVLLHFKKDAGRYGDAMFASDLSQRFARFTLYGGIVAPLLLNAGALLREKPHAERPNFAKTLVTAALTLAGGFVLRQTLIEAGKRSADDPQLAFYQPK
jgi:formate-dependent nitrite reductase membrane component NrfD